MTSVVTDAEQIRAWLHAQAAKERELLRTATTTAVYLLAAERERAYRCCALGIVLGSAEQIALWFDDYAREAAEGRDEPVRSMLEPGYRFDPILGHERYLVYKACAQGIREGAWRQS